LENRWTSAFRKDNTLDRTNKVEAGAFLIKPFFLILARDKRYVEEKIVELERLSVPYIIVCGERLNHPNVPYQAPRGKYDAINFAATLIPKDVNTVILNDVDTKIRNLNIALQRFEEEDLDLLFATERVTSGPQELFLRLQNWIRRKIPIAASGELMLIKRNVLERVLPLKPCKAEDTHILFKVLEYQYNVAFCDECYAETERTKTAEEEEAYKRRTVAGIYQALSYTHPPWSIRLFYVILPLLSPLLLVLGKRGYFWMKGILLGLIDYLRGDRSGVWHVTYMK